MLNIPTYRDVALVQFCSDIKFLGLRNNFRDFADASI